MGRVFGFGPKNMLTLGRPWAGIVAKDKCSSEQEQKATGLKIFEITY
jgi:hypothetical protein